eukprot:31494-Pelagococcus_subviridis.AAC.2
MTAPAANGRPEGARGRARREPARRGARRRGRRARRAVHRGRATLNADETVDNLQIIYLSSTIPRPPPPSLRRLSPRGAAPSIPARCAYAPPSSAASSRSACSAYSLKYATTPSSPAFPK